MPELTMQLGNIPLPEPTVVSRPFWDGCASEELRFQRCESCGAPNFAPAVACRRCLSRALRWERSCGRGTIYSWTLVWRPPLPAFAVPYAPAIVELDEGYRMLTSVVDCDVATLAVGLRVQVAFGPVQSSGLRLPYFRPE